MFLPRRPRFDSTTVLLAGLWLAAAAAFVIMAAFAEEHTRFAGDLWISRHVQGIDSSLFAGSADVAEAMASAPYVVALIAGPIILLWYFHHRREAALMLVVPFGWTVNAVVKRLVDRPRPSDLLVSVSGHSGDASFPSGHMIVATLAFAMIFYYSAVLIRRVWVRTVMQVFSVYGVIFTGIARIYHGVHWASDVYGSLLLAGVLLAVVIAMHSRTRVESSGVRWSVEEQEWTA